jgi:hypothetical protein
MEGRSDASSFLNSSNGDSPTLYSNGLNAVQQQQQQYHHPYENTTITSNGASNTMKNGAGAKCF